MLLNNDPTMNFSKKKKLSDAIRDYAITYGNCSESEAIEHLKHRNGFPKKIGDQQPYGFDHNYILTNSNATSNSSLNTAAILNHPLSNRTLTVRTNVPGLQLYTSNYLKNDMAFKENAEYKQWQGVCLESQHFPDSINVEENNDHDEFVKGSCIILKPGGDDYEHIIEYQLDF